MPVLTQAWQREISHSVTLAGAQATSQAGCDIFGDPPVSSTVAVEIPFQDLDHIAEAAIRIDKIGTEALFVGCYFLQGEPEEVACNWWYDKDKRSHYINGFTGALQEGYQALSDSACVLRDGDEVLLQYDLWLGRLTFSKDGREVGVLEGLHGSRPAFAVQFCGEAQQVSLTRLEIVEHVYADGLDEAAANGGETGNTSGATRSPSPVFIPRKPKMGDLRGGSFLGSFESAKGASGDRVGNQLKDKILELELEARSQRERRRRAEAQLQIAEEQIGDLCLQNMALSEEVRRYKMLYEQLQRRHNMVNVRASGSQDRASLMLRSSTENSLLGSNKSSTFDELAGT